MFSASKPTVEHTASTTVAPLSDELREQAQQTQSVSPSIAVVSETESYGNTSTIQQLQKRQFSCLYTKQKTQKRKVWKDGRLVIKGCSAILHDGEPLPGSGDPMLDQCEVPHGASGFNPSPGTLFEMEKYLVTVQDPWTTASRTSAITLSSLSHQPSNGMKKVLTRKFQRPTRQAPPPQEQNQRLPQWAKRRRPLQPGELCKLYYGTEPNTSNHKNIDAADTAVSGNSFLQDQSHPVVPNSNRAIILPSQQPHPQHSVVPSKGGHMNSVQSFDNPFGQQHRTSIPAYSHPASSFALTNLQFNAANNSVNPDFQAQSCPQQEQDRDNQNLPMGISSKINTSGGNHTMPQALQEPTKITTVQLPKCRQGSIFNNNGFDPSSFYGEEDEDEEDDNCDDDKTNVPGFDRGHCVIRPTVMTSWLPTAAPASTKDSVSTTGDNFPFSVTDYSDGGTAPWMNGCAKSETNKSDLVQPSQTTSIKIPSASPVQTTSNGDTSKTHSDSQQSPQAQVSETAPSTSLTKNELFALFGMTQPEAASSVVNSTGATVETTQHMLPPSGETLQSSQIQQNDDFVLPSQDSSDDDSDNE